MLKGVREVSTTEADRWHTGWLSGQTMDILLIHQHTGNRWTPKTQVRHDGLSGLKKLRKKKAYGRHSPLEGGNHALHVQPRRRRLCSGGHLGDSQSCKNKVERPRKSEASRRYRREDHRCHGFRGRNAPRGEQNPSVRVCSEISLLRIDIQTQASGWQTLIPPTEGVRRSRCDQLRQHPTQYKMIYLTHLKIVQPLQPLGRHGDLQLRENSRQSRIIILFIPQNRAFASATSICEHQGLRTCHIALRCVE